jgi:hypothetical protein
MNETEIKDRLTIHTKWGIGLEVSAQTIYNIDRSDMKLLNKFKQRLHQLRKKYSIMTKREFDKRYERHRQTYNEDIPHDMVTHAIDYYRWSDGSLQKRYHARKNMEWEGKPLLMALIVNVRTQKRYWMIWDDGKETTVRTEQLIIKAQSNGEQIDYLVSDRLYKKTITALENLGVTPIVYPKEKEAIRLIKGVLKKVKGICYNTEAERQFTNISKTFYSIKDMTTELTWEEAKQLFEAVLMIVYEKDDTQLLAWDELYEANRQRVKVAIPNTQPIRE